jgi:hypothetical protein
MDPGSSLGRQPLQERAIAPVPEDDQRGVRMRGQHALERRQRHPQSLLRIEPSDPHDAAPVRQPGGRNGVRESADLAPVRDHPHLAGKPAADERGCGFGHGHLHPNP